MSLKDHWNKVYQKNTDEKLGWYESDHRPTLKLITESGVKISDRILIVGSGTTSLPDELIELGYSEIIATDISEDALDRLSRRLGKEKITYIVNDLTAPDTLLKLDPVDLWIDRAVLHFFTGEKDRENYFDLLDHIVKAGGYVLLAQFSLSGASTCSGLPVFRYSCEMLEEQLGDDYELVRSFEYIYINPTGGERPYIYTLFRRNS